MLFSDTLRFNLDPFDKHTDAEIWSALESVEMKSKLLVNNNQECVSAVCGGGGLERAMIEGGKTLSGGERQLLCLARAVLENRRKRETGGGRVVVIDEATANLDTATEAIIQRTIRREFADCTRLTIAHRLLTVADSSTTRILCMSAGKICDQGSPRQLLDDPKSVFSQLAALLPPHEKSLIDQLAHQSSS